MLIVWDAKTTEVETADMLVTIRTGMSAWISNRLTVLTLHAPAEACALQRQVNDLATRFSEGSASGLVNVPEIVALSLPTSRGPLPLTMIWGITLTGKSAVRVVAGQRRTLRLAEYAFVMIHEEELDEILSGVFHLERTLTPLCDAAAPPTAPVPRKATGSRASRSA